MTRPTLAERYERHRAEIDSITTTSLAESWFDFESVDYWRHQRMYATVTALLRCDPDSRWLTVGDGRFGLDAIKLRRIEPRIRVLPTDVGGRALQVAKERGLIDDYRVANAEALPFDDNSFDFAFCKESYHHFPRPLVALYEMIRVARRAVLLIEPNDGQPLPALGWLLEQAKAPLRKLLGRRMYPRDYWSFETTGNYIYSTSQREMEKVCLGIGLPSAAFFRFNDHYVEGAELEKLHAKAAAYKRIKHEIALADFFSRIGLRRPGMMTSILFKAEPDPALRDSLAKDGYEVVDFPKNPYSETSASPTASESGSSPNAERSTGG